MDFETLDTILIFIKRSLSFLGTIVILTGAIYAICLFLVKIFKLRKQHGALSFDRIRLDLGRAIILGLEFIIAADIIETTATPDYYALGILGLLVLIRTFLNYFLNRDLMALSHRERHRLD